MDSTKTILVFNITTYSQQQASNPCCINAQDFFLSILSLSTSYAVSWHSGVWSES